MGNIKKVLNKMPSLNILPLSFVRVKENIAMLPFPVLSDILFLFLYGFVVMGFIAEMVSAQLFEFGVELTKSGQEFSSVSQMLLQENARPMLLKAALLITLMIAAVYVIYCLFQGFSWWYCRRMASGKKQSKLSHYLREFCKVNIFWFILVVIYNFIAFSRDFLSQAENPEPGLLLNTLFIVILYFVLVSYSMLPKTKGLGNIKRSFSIGIKRIADLLPAYLIIFIAFSIIELLLDLSMKLSSAIFMLVGVFVLLPALSWMRVYFIGVVNDITGNKK